MTTYLTHCSVQYKIVARLSQACYYRRALHKRTAQDCPWILVIIDNWQCISKHSVINSWHISIPLWSSVIDFDIKIVDRISTSITEI
jgi:hypothetical protein